jgi:hypothetical protein
MKRFTLPLIFGVLGFFFSTRIWIKSYDKLPPYGGLIVYYIIITFTIIFLQKIGLVVGGLEFSGFNHTVGTLLVIFSFFIIFDWESCYINIVTKGHCNEKNISNIYFASEDGAVYDLWEKIFKGKTQLNRILTYIITPVVLSFVGIMFLSETEKINL